MQASDELQSRVAYCQFLALAPCTDWTFLWTANGFQLRKRQGLSSEGRRVAWGDSQKQMLPRRLACNIISTPAAARWLMKLHCLGSSSLKPRTMAMQRTPLPPDLHDTQLQLLGLSCSGALVYGLSTQSLCSFHLVHLAPTGLNGHSAGMIAHDTGWANAKNAGCIQADASFSRSKWTCTVCRCKSSPDTAALFILQLNSPNTAGRPYLRQPAG